MLKRYLLNSVESFTERGHKFSHIIELNSKTNTNEIYMKYEYYINKPMKAVELKLIEISTQNQHLIQSLDRTIIGPLNRKNSHLP